MKQYQIDNLLSTKESEAEIIYRNGDWIALNTLSEDYKSESGPCSSEDLAKVEWYKLIWQHFDIVIERFPEHRKISVLKKKRNEWHKEWSLSRDSIGPWGDFYQ